MHQNNLSPMESQLHFTNSNQTQQNKALPPRPTAICQVAGGSTITSHRSSCSKSSLAVSLRQGLVETSEDFGMRTPVPEQRELLDWLASDFMENGWSQKKLLKLILMSKTYQQSSAVTQELLAKDPKNVWLSRGPRFRAEAESCPRHRANSVRTPSSSGRWTKHHSTGAPKRFGLQLHVSRILESYRRT